MRLDAKNPWRQDLRLRVLNDALDDDGDLSLRVQLPIWPNEQAGWVAASTSDSHGPPDGSSWTSPSIGSCGPGPGAWSRT